MNTSTACLVVAGSANLDFVVRAPHIPAPGETVLGDTFATFPGGKGANQAVACARAGGVATRFVGAFGDDAFAQPLRDSLQAAGVELHAVLAAGVPTGSAFICVSAEGENAITVAPGANAALSASHALPLQGASHLLLQLETPLATVQAFAERARAAGVRVVLNAAPAQALAPALLAAVDLLVVNEGELTTLAGAGGSTAERMRRLPVPAVVTTLGAAGAVALDGEGWHLQPSFAVAVVDTTAAGDTFVGALASALARGEPMTVALRDASAAAALACTKPGAQASIPGRADVLRLIDTNPSPAATAALAARCGLPWR